MKKHIAFFLLFILTANNFFAQEKVIKHIVQPGETVTQIAIRYKTTPLDIYKLNPDATAGIKADMQLLVPNSGKAIVAKVPTKNIGTSKTVAKSDFTSHKVQSKETLYSLAVQFKTTVEAIENANPTLKTVGLKIGEEIQIPSKSQEPRAKSQDVKVITQKPTTKIQQTTTKTHTVEAKETKYSIAKKYNTTIETLENQNPQIAEGLEIGMQLQVGGSQKAVAKTVAKPINKSEPTLIIKNLPKTDASETVKPLITFKDYTIKPQETVYSLSNKFGLTQAELLAINPSLAEGVKIGEIIKCPSNVNWKDVDTKVFTDLSSSLKSQNRKKLVLLLPFNISKIENDTITSTATRLKKDKFLNMTLDFYAGALQAIDSAKKLGIKMDIKILDSQETKSSSNVQNLVDSNNFAKTDVIIGPFYQSNVEKTADLLRGSKTIVISPLSKETHKASPNLLVSNISTELVKNAMFDYMKAKNGNVLAIIDNKKLATKQLLKQYSDVKIIPINDKNTFASDSLAQHFSKSNINFVILDSEKTGLILKTANALINLQKDFQVQLVILEKNETLDFDEIPLSKLTRLQMLYPSLSKDNNSAEANVFEKEFKLKNKIYPNQYATRGFDLTFDTILRLSQDKSFLETIEELSSEQVENKFEYEKNNEGGFFNKGVYILEYQSDLTIKEAK